MGHGMEENIDIQVSYDMKWHKLTTIAKPGEPITAETVFRYNCEQWEDYRKNPRTGEFVKTDWHWPVSDDNDRVIGKPFAPSYSMVDMKSEWANTEACLQGTAYTVVSAGTTKGRQLFYITFRLDELAAIKVGTHEFHQFLNCIGSFDKTTGREWVQDIHDVHCWNTLNATRALRTEALTINHSANTAKRNHEVKAHLEKMFGVAAVFERTMQSLDQTKCTESNARKLLAGLVTVDKPQPCLSTRSLGNVETMVSLFNGRGIGCNGETMLDTLSAVTEFYTRQSAGPDAWKQLESSEFGSGSEFKSRAVWEFSNEDRRKNLILRGETAFSNYEKAEKIKDKAKAQVKAALASMS